MRLLSECYNTFWFESLCQIKLPCVICRYFERNPFSSQILSQSFCSINYRFVNCSNIWFPNAYSSILSTCDKIISTLGELASIYGTCGKSIIKVQIHRLWIPDRMSFITVIQLYSSIIRALNKESSTWMKANLVGWLIFIDWRRVPGQLLCS